MYFLFSASGLVLIYFIYNCFVRQFKIKNNVKKFDREHKVKKTKKGDLKLANRVTKKYVQIAKQI